MNETRNVPVSRREDCDASRISRHRHYELLSDRIDRRVGHLREELFEIRVKKTRLVGEHGEGCRRPSIRPPPRWAFTIGFRIMSSSSLGVAVRELLLGKREDIERLGRLLHLHAHVRIQWEKKILLEPPAVWFARGEDAP